MEKLILNLKSSLLNRDQMRTIMGGEKDPLGLKCDTPCSTNSSCYVQGATQCQQCLNYWEIGEKRCGTNPFP